MITNPKSVVGDASPSVLPTLPRPSLLDAVLAVRALGGSDLHLASGANPRARVDGALVELLGGAWSADLLRDELRGLLTDAAWQRFERELELDFSAETAGGRLRINLFLQRGELGAAVRLVPDTVRSIRQLGLPDAVASLADLPRGLVLVSGPTGSGKSATLAAMLDRINTTRSGHIVTIEDPIEHVHESKGCVVTQREVDRDTRDYASALRQALRQDPDVLLLGELRDRETIAVALNAAETGHLVLATLHTPDAAQTIDRILDAFPGGQQEQVRAQLSLTLKGVVAQTLIPRAIGAGRVVAAEVLTVTPAIAHLIRTGKTHQIGSAMASGADLGMQTLDQRLAELADSGAISPGEAMKLASSPDVLARLLSASLAEWDARAQGGGTR
ncbi:MAG: type pili twitching motility protein PilT [Naasia sp.]|nr:type pili twitching motility protein PilT [Naasia sp.]